MAAVQLLAEEGADAAALSALAQRWGCVMTPTLYWRWC